MASSSTLLSLALLLLSASCAHAAGGGFKNIHMYMHAITSGTNATMYAVVPPLAAAGNTSFGEIQLLDNELRDGADPATSSLLGRLQGIVAYAGLVSPPGMLTSMSFVFTAGKYNASTLVMMGTIVNINNTFERPLVGGTGAFRMTSGYCIISNGTRLTTVSSVFDVNLYVKMERNLSLKEEGNLALDA
ncbi:unnamed protein product [Alopecurus aequalis]